MTLNTNGSFTFTPAANYAGPDSFTYRASDGSAFSTASTVQISITNTAPVANANNYTTSKNIGLTVAAGSGRMILLAGRPIGEPVARGGPFVMNTEDEIRQAWEEFRSGRLVDG